MIFLCIDDVQPVYNFENICIQNNEDGKQEIIYLKDRSFKIFFNASACDKLKSEKARNFFMLLNGESAKDDFSIAIEKKLILAKKNMNWRRQYMTWQQTLDEEKEIAREEAKKEGLKEGSLKAAENLIGMNVLTKEQIAQATGLSIEDVSNLMKKTN